MSIFVFLTQPGKDEKRPEITNSLSRSIQPKESKTNRYNFWQTSLLKNKQGLYVRSLQSGIFKFFLQSCTVHTYVAQFECKKMKKNIISLFNNYFNVLSLYLGLITKQPWVVHECNLQMALVSTWRLILPTQNIKTNILLNYCIDVVT